MLQVYLGRDPFLKETSCCLTCVGKISLVFFSFFSLIQTWVCKEVIWKSWRSCHFVNIREVEFADKKKYAVMAPDKTLFPNNAYDFRKHLFEHCWLPGFNFWVCSRHSWQVMQASIWKHLCQLQASRQYRAYLSLHGFRDLLTFSYLISWPSFQS